MCRANRVGRFVYFGNPAQERNFLRIVYRRIDNRARMLTIRPEQVKLFSQEEERKFVERVAIHLKKYFPKRCAAQGEARLHDTIRRGIGRAASYGVTAEREVCKFIHLMIVFGPDFDTDQRYSWAGDILRAPHSPNGKIELLHSTAVKRLRRAQ
jgi:hypothetical protein